MKRRERELFFAIASYAINNGFKVSLERKNSSYQSKALNGALVNSESMDGGLILRVKPLKESETEE